LPAATSTGRNVSTVAEPPKDATSDLPEGIMEIARWLYRYGPARVGIRPRCPKHGLLMKHGKTINGQTHYYCPLFTSCGEGRKVRPREV